MVVTYEVRVLATRSDADGGLLDTLFREQVGYAVVSSLDSRVGQVDAVLLDLSASGLDELDALAEHCRRLGVALICALPRELVAKYDASQASDFFLLPPAPGEVSARIRQTLIRLKQTEPARSEESLRRGDLYIDLARYEVFHRGNRVLLTFKEYQLLSLLAASPGRVFTRETLLSEIWQYDYYEGTRTVDVHIRRLRSKLEDAGQDLIETVRNVGYRFRREAALLGEG